MKLGARKHPGASTSSKMEGLFSWLENPRIQAKSPFKVREKELMEGGIIQTGTEGECEKNIMPAACEH